MVALAKTAVQFLAVALFLDILSVHVSGVLTAEGGTKVTLPPLPNPLPDTMFTITVPFHQYALRVGPSIRRHGSAFCGFSIEMSDLRSIGECDVLCNLLLSGLDLIIPLARKNL